MTRPPHLRRATRVVLAVVLGAAAALVPAAASAHVTVQPGEAEAGSYSVVAFRVPNERDDAATVRVRVLLPEDQPVASVSTTPVPGWEVATRTRALDEPIDLHGRQVTEVVSELEWTATGDGIGPGEYEDLEVSMGPLPDSGEMVFRAFQTYDSGEEVPWNEVAVDDSVEPDNPAPVLRLVGSDDTAEGAAPTTGDDASALPTVLSVVALLVALAALGMVWRQGRGRSRA